MSVRLKSAQSSETSELEDLTYMDNLYYLLQCLENIIETEGKSARARELGEGVSSVEHWLLAMW